MSDEPRMTGMDKEIFNATRTLTSLLNDACNHWNYLCPYLEKLAGVADDALRGYQRDYPEQVAELIDYRRKREQRGDAAALREACAKMRDLLMLRGDGKAYCTLSWDEFNESQKMLRAALSAPPRNCDVGTVEEQGERCLAQFDQWRRRGDGKKLITAIMEWAQMPYEAEKGAAHGEA